MSALAFTLLALVLVGPVPALLARACGRPVKLLYDRHEDLRVTPKRHPGRVRHRTAVAADGTLLAMDVDVLLDGGAYTTLSPVVLSPGVSAGPPSAASSVIGSEPSPMVPPSLSRVDGPPSVAEMSSTSAPTQLSAASFR